MTCPHCNRTWLSSGFIHCQKCGRDMVDPALQEKARTMADRVFTSTARFANLDRSYALQAPSHIRR